MDPQQAPHNLPFEPEDLPLDDQELESIAPPSIPKVQAPVALPPLAPPIPSAIPPAPTPSPMNESVPMAPPVAPPKPPSNFLSGEPLMTPPTSSGPKQPEDMFGGLEASRATPPVPRVMPSDPMMSASPAYGKYVLYICCLIAGLGILAAVLWYFAIHRPAEQAAQDAVVPAVVPTEVVATSTPVLIPTAPLVTPPAQTAPLVVPTSTTPAAVNTDVLPPVSSEPVTIPPAGVNVPPPTPVTPEPAPTTVFVDGDKDGLSDTREQELGTDPANKDTDGDSLSDGDEVLVYGTNPLKTDTDGDTFADGLEVKGGYNPRGPGKCTNTDCHL